LSLPGQHAKARLFTPPHPLLRAGRPGEYCPFPGRSHAGQSFGVELRQCSAGRAASLRPDRVRSAHVSRAWRPWGGDVAEPSIPLRSLACPASIEPKITVLHADCTYRLHAFIALRLQAPKAQSNPPASQHYPPDQPASPAAIHDGNRTMPIRRPLLALLLLWWSAQMQARLHGCMGPSRGRRQSCSIHVSPQNSSASAFAYANASGKIGQDPSMGVGVNVTHDSMRGSTWAGIVSAKGSNYPASQNPRQGTLASEARRSSMQSIEAASVAMVVGS
jgi:hypothetical protein